MGVRTRVYTLSFLFFFVSFMQTNEPFGRSRAEAASLPTKSRKSSKPEAHLSPKEEALRQIQNIPQTEKSEAPSVMMPLKADYQTLERRAWDWTVELELLQRHLEIPRPATALGPANLGELSDFTFLSLSSGIEKTWGNVRLSGLAQFTASAKSSEGQSPSGMSFPVRYNWLGTGLESRFSYLIDEHWSAGLGLALSQVTLSQSSSQSELAQWARAFGENSQRLSAQYSWEGGQTASLHLRRLSNEFQSATSIGLSVGVRW